MHRLHAYIHDLAHPFFLNQGARRFFTARSSLIRKRTLDSNVAWLVSRQANFKVLFLASDNHALYDFGFPKNQDMNSKWTMMWCFGV